MEFREFARGETDAFVERLVSAAEAVRAEFEARVMALEAELESAFDAHRRVDAERIAAETAWTEEATARAEEAAARAAETAARERAEEELRSTRELLERAREEATELAQTFEAEAAQRAQLEIRLQESSAAEGTLRADVAQELEQERRRTAEAEAAAAALRDQLETERQTMKAKGERLVEEIDTLRAEHAAATEALRDVQEQLDALHEHYAQRVETIRTLEQKLQAGDSAATAILKGAVEAVDALDDAPSVSDLFAALVELLATELPRVALFRVKGNHLEGEHVAGLGDGMHVKKLVIPLTLDSLVSRAVTRGALQRGDGDQLADIRSPFGDAPASALATPIVFRGETLAALYADADGAITEAQASFALLLVRHATVTMAKLTQELKTVKELREYAAMLLQEAEQMFLADVEGGSPEQDCIRRLQDALDCGRELYAQRAALEGTFAADIFEDQIASAVRVPESQFAKALVAALAHPRAQRTAS